MIFKVFGVLQFILIQVISAQIANRGLSRQNVLNNFANTPLDEYGRSRRQINNAPVDLPGNGNLAANDFAYGMPFINSLPNGNFLHGNGLPNNFALNNGLPNNFALNNVLPNSSPHNFSFPNMNVIPQNRLLPSFNDVISKGLPFNNLPNGLPSLNNGLPGFNNGLPGFNNGLPGFNNGLPGFNNGLPGFNNVPNGLPSFNNVPSVLPSFNNGWPSPINLPNVLPGLNDVPNGFSGLNNVPNVLQNLNNNPTFTNKVLNLNNVPAGSNILNFNNLPAANTLPNINNIAIPNGWPSFNNLPCNTLPLSNGLPLNNLPSGNILPPINNQLPYFNNFRITEIGIGNGVPYTNRFPRDNQPVDNMSPNANNLQNINELRQQPSDELINMKNYQNNNGILSIANMPSASVLPNIVPDDNRFSSVNHYPISSSISNIANEVPNIKNMQFKNGLPDVSHFQNYNAMPVNEQRFVNNVPFNNDFVVPNHFPVNTGIPNTNSRLVNAIDNGMPLANGGHLNDILLAKRGLPETYSQNIDGSGFSGNDFQFGNIQVPVNNWHHDFVPSNMPANQNLLLSEGVQIFTNVPNDHSSVLTSNNLNLAQELVKNLQIEGVANLPFLNGLPVAGITETVTVLNGPYNK